MRAVVLRVRGMLRRRWRAAVVVAGIVAVVTGAVLALAAGARRTSSAPDAYTTAVGGDADGYVEQRSGRPRTAGVAALPGVESVDAMTFVFAGLVDAENGPASGTISFSGSRPSTSRLVAGRAADPTDPHEFVADERFVADHDARLGDRYRLVTWTQDQADRGDFFDLDRAEGPSFEVVLVGIVDAADVLETEYSIAVFSPALLEGDVGMATTNMNVRLDPGVTTERLRAELDGLPGGSEFSVEPGRVINADVRNAVEAQAQGIGLMAAVAAVAAVVALGQLLTRHVRLPAAERARLVALGFTTRQLAAETITRAAVPATAGTVVGATFAVAASGQFPTGFVQALEPHPGLRVDVGALTVGGGLLLVGVLAWVGVALLAVGRGRARRSPSITIEKIARRAPSPAAATGTRFAFTGHDGSSTAAIGALVALAVLVGGVVGATAFAASVDRLVSDRSQFGSNYTVSLGDNSGLSASELRATFEADPDVAGLMILTEGPARAGGATVGLVGVEHVHGDVAPRLLAGRLPQAPDEVALGRVAARQLDLHVGDAVALVGSGGRSAYRVVGLAVVPTIAGNDGVGQGGVVTADGLLRLEPSPATSMAAVVLRPGAPPDAGRRLAALVGEEPGTQDVPSAILNVARVRRIPGLLAVLLAALTLLTMVHGLIVSIQRRRRDLAVLRALGADRRFIARAIHWQATGLTALPLVLGVPLGLIAGSFVFRAFADRIGAIPDPAVPMMLVLATIISLVGVANLAAVVPARRARSLSIAQQLQVE